MTGVTAGDCCDPIRTPSGISALAATDAPTVPWVGLDGSPTDVTLAIDEIHETAVELVYPAESIVPSEGTCILCLWVRAGPHGSLVYEFGHRFAIVGDRAAVYETDWRYAGAVGDLLVFTRVEGDSMTIGTFAVARS